MVSDRTDDEGIPIKVNVVDKRHHACAEEQGAGLLERSPYPTFVEELKARADAAERRAREAVRRADAEIDAVRERLQRDVERRVIQGKAALLSAVLEMVDNLDRAAGVASTHSPVLGEGIDLIRQQALAILRDQGVEPIETVGLEYDPNVAEAVEVQAVDRGSDNMVIEEVQRGYRLGEMILRPAKVKVGKAPVA